MTYDEALDFVRRHHQGVLATIKCDGRPQLSNVSYLLDDDGTVKISVTRDRAKTRNVLRDPRVSMTALGDNFYEYVVVEGMAAILEDALPLLRHVYEGIRGEAHPDWEEFDEAMIRDGRVVMSITIQRLYPLTD